MLFLHVPFFKGRPDLFIWPNYLALDKPVR
jgi:hypothetical protein